MRAGFAYMEIWGANVFYPVNLHSMRSISIAFRAGSRPVRSVLWIIGTGSFRNTVGRSRATIVVLNGALSMRFHDLFGRFIMSYESAIPDGMYTQFG